MLLLMVMAVGMSTIDSFINATSVVVVHDLMPQDSSEKHLIAWGRRVGLLLGGCTLGALLTVYFFSNIMGLFFWLGSTLLNSLSVPFIAGVMGLKVDRRAFRYSVLAYLGFFILTYVPAYFGFHWIMVPTATSSYGKMY